MKIKSKGIMLIILACVVAFYNLALFIPTMNVIKMPTFWISYGFIMFSMAIAAMAILIKKPFTEGTKITFTVPIIRVIFAYFIVEFIVGTLFMILQYVTTVKLVLLVQLLLLIVFVIIGLALFLGSNHISQNYEKQKKDVLYQNMLYAQVLSLASSVNSADVKQKLAVIADKIKFSDFNAYPELSEDDSLIRSTVTQMEITDDDIELSNLAKRLERLVDKRNEMCKYIKKSRG